MMPRNENTVIGLNDVGHTYIVGASQQKVLNDVTFSLKQNTFNIIYGPSGSGKSTLLNILAGLQKPTIGRVNFNGKALYDLTPDQLAHFRANEIGIVYQQNFWIKSLTVVDNVAIPLFYLGHTKEAARKLALEALEKVGMLASAHRYPNVMSGGEQQRIAMARAIVNNPKFIIADEPTGNLDSVNGDMIMHLLQNFKTEYGRTIILVTHNMEYIPLADHLLNIKDGNVIQTTDDSNITKTANEMINNMRGRIEILSKVKNRKIQ